MASSSRQKRCREENDDGMEYSSQPKKQEISQPLNLFEVFKHPKIADQIFRNLRVTDLKVLSQIGPALLKDSVRSWLRGLPKKEAVFWRLIPQLQYVWSKDYALTPAVFISLEYEIRRHIHDLLALGGEGSFFVEPVWLQRLLDEFCGFNFQKKAIFLFVAFGPVKDWGGAFPQIMWTEPLNNHEINLTSSGENFDTLARVLTALYNTGNLNMETLNFMFHFPNDPTLRWCDEVTHNFVCCC